PVADHRHQHDGAVDADDHRTAGLTGDFAGLQGDEMLAVLELLGVLGHEPGSLSRRLAAQAEFADQRLVALVVLALEVIQQPATLVDQLEQATAGMVVLLVLGEVLGQVIDAGRPQGTLHCRGTGIVGSTLVLADDASGIFDTESHLWKSPDMRSEPRGPCRTTPGSQINVLRLAKANDILAAAAAQQQAAIARFRPD